MTQPHVIERPVLGAGDLVRRCALACLGIFFVGLAAVGVVLPGIPATGPLILASVLFTKSCPALERRLIRHRFFGKFHPYLDGKTQMPWRAKLITMAIMWTSIAASCLVFASTSGLPMWLMLVLVISGAVGTWFIARFGRQHAAKITGSKNNRRIAV